MRAAYRGSQVINDAAPLVHEYFRRKALAQLGYTSNLSELPAFKVDVYAIIESELNACQQKELKAVKRGR